MGDHDEEHIAVLALGYVAVDVGQCLFCKPSIYQLGKQPVRQTV